jgi:hypothetical protein
MKRISLLALILCACLASVARAQPNAAARRFGKQWPLQHRSANRMPQTGAANNLNSTARAAAAAGGKTWDFGHYPGGTGASFSGINNRGVAIGWGDVAAGDYRMIGLPISGASAGTWFKSDASSENDPWGGLQGQISDTGLIVGSITGKDGEARAYAWSPDFGGIDLGALPGDKGSTALAVNHSGTMIVGVSYPEPDPDGNWAASTAVAWTPEMAWKDGRWTITWTIHALPNGGLDQPGSVYEGETLAYWGGWGVNDRGQIAGGGWATFSLAVVWTPIQGGKDWEIHQLPVTGDYISSEAEPINNRGEIGGEVLLPDWSGWAPAVWRMSSETHTWEMIALPVHSGVPVGWNGVGGINESGDAVGMMTDADGNAVAVRWMTKDPKFVQAIGFPGSASWAGDVNDAGIVVGGYAAADGNSTAFAVKIR